MRPDDIVYSIPVEKFYYRGPHGRWELTSPIGKEGITAHLNHHGVPQEMVEGLVYGGRAIKVHGIDMAPNQPEVFRNGSLLFLNAWVKPELTPAPGPWPTIERTLRWLTNHDDKALEWLLTWLAAKIQNPALVPKIATLFITEPGAGKGLLAFTMRSCLGWENTAQVGRGALENKFNQHWAGKLFVLADEVLSNDSVKDISERLKILIDAKEIELEGKGINQRAIANRTAWMFASNDATPLVIEKGDRRYSVFTNNSPIPADYKKGMDGCFLRDRTTPTDAFKAELAGFMEEMLHFPVDLELIRQPHENAARRALVDASKPAHEIFIERINDGQFDELYEAAQGFLPDDLRDRGNWDFGEHGVATQKLYAVYREFCKATGAYPMRENKFGIHATKHWDRGRRSSPKTHKQVYVYVIPRTSSAGPKSEKAAATQPAAKA